MITISEEQVAAAEAEVSEAERGRATAEEALMAAPNSTVKAAELAGALKRMAQCRANVRELREAFEAQVAAERSAATREELEKAAAKEIAAAGKEVKAARGKLEDAATAAQRALVELMRQTEAYDEVVVRHAGILSSLGLDASGASGGADTFVGGVVKVKGDVHHTAGSGSVLAHVVFQVAEARLPQPNYMAGVLQYNMGRIVPEEREDGLLSGLESPEVRKFPELPSLRVATY